MSDGVNFFFSPPLFIVNVNHNIDHWVILKELNMVLKKKKVQLILRSGAWQWGGAQVFYWLVSAATAWTSVD